MHRETRQHFNRFLKQIAKLNNVENTNERFYVTPAVEQALLEKVQDSSPFLSAINNIMVDAQENEKVYVGVNSTIAGRTDTSDGLTERKPRDIKSSSNDKYRCEQTNYDTYLRYATLDAWRHRPDFQVLLRAAISKQIARDRMMIGFNGTSVAATTDRSSNPLLQDVNKGWLKHIQENKSKAVLDGAKIGGISGHDYLNVDAAVFDVINELIEPWHRDSDLVVICGRKLLADKYFSLLNGNDLPTERAALQGLMTSLNLGGRPTIAVPFFPDNAILITPLNNLSIYTQRETTRMYYADNPKLDRIEEYRSVNEAYVVEDYDACCLLTGIKTPNAQKDAFE